MVTIWGGRYPGSGDRARSPSAVRGGVSALDDVRALCAVESEGIMGAIIGRALYDGAIDLAEAQRLAEAAGSV